MGKASDAAVGMMDSAYFVGRKELLDFFNELLQLNLTKIEQTASGAVACQLTDYIYPGTVQMSRVNWEAKSDYEYIQNYKLLQASFTKNRIQRHVDVDRLIRAKYQDNLEFCQWMKAFHDQSGIYRPEYDPSAVRARGKGGKKVGDFLNKNAKTFGSKPPPVSTRPRTGTTTTTTTTRKPTTTRPTTTTTARNTSRPLRERQPVGGSVRRKTTQSVEADATLMKKNVELTAKVTQLEQTVVEVEQERNFYFQKLRDVEVLMQVQQEKGLEGIDVEKVFERVFKVLYATAEDNIVVNDEGEIVGEANDEEDFEDDDDLVINQDTGGEDEDDALAEFSAKIDAEMDGL